MKRLVFITLFLFLTLNVVSATQTNLTTGYSGTVYYNYNFYTTSNMHIGCYGTCTTGLGDGAARYLINFTLNDSLKNKYISSAKLYLYIYNSYNPQPNNWTAANVSVYRLNNTFSGSITWATQPSFNTVAESTTLLPNGTGLSFTPYWANWTLNATLLSDMINGITPYYGYIFKTEETTNGNQKGGYSFTGTYPPILSIDYTTVINPVTPTAQQNFTQASPTVTFNLTNGTAVDACSWTNNAGVNNYTMARTGSSFNATNSTMTQGSQLITYYCNKTSDGSWVTSSTTNITVDTLYPTIDFGTGTAANNSNLSQNSIYINTTWTESNFQNITFLLWNATAQKNSTTYTSPTYAINFTNQLDGVYNYNVTICDDFNQCNTTSTRRITIDDTNPTVTLNTPINNSVQTSASQNLTVNLTDNLGIKNATLYIYNSSGIYNQTSVTYSSGIITSTLGIVVNLVDNVYTWFYQLFDWAGNSATSQNYTLNVDVGNLDFCHAITSSGTYLLNKNIIATGDCFNIQANNVVFDCNSFSITGPGTSEGIYTTGYNNITIQNCKIKNFTYQIYFESSNNSKFYNLNLSNSIVTGFYGIVLRNSNNSIFNNLTIRDNSGTVAYGLDIELSKNILVNNSKIDNNSGTVSYGLYLDTVNDSIFNNDNFSNSNYGVRMVRTFNNLYSGSSLGNLEILTNNNGNTLLNTSEVVSSISGLGAAPITKKWYLDLNVTNSSGSPLNAVVQILDAYNQSVYLGNSPGGSITTQQISEFIANATSPNVFYLTPHSINVTLAGYNENDSSVNLSSTHNTKLSIVLVQTDVTPPTVNIVYPTATNYSSVTAINYTVSDASALSSCKYSLDGINNVSITCGDNKTGLTANQGNNTWKVYATDIWGNTGSSSVTFFVDGIFPTIDYGTNTQNSGVNLSQSNIYINTTWNETNFKNITFRYNSSLSYTSTSPIYFYNKTGLADGNYTYNVTICDIMNQCNTTANQRITLDTVSPSLSIVYPASANYSNLSTLNFTASDLTSGLLQCKYNLGPGNFSTSCSSNVPGLTPVQGSNTWIVYATDYAGNMNSSTVTFFVDFIQPNATLNTPANATVSNVQSNNLTANLTDNLGLLNYTLTVYNQTGVYNQTSGTISGLQSTVGIVINLVEGVYNWFYKVFDVVGNSFTSSNNTLTIDLTKPTQAFLYPLNRYNYTQVNQLNYSSNGAYCWYSIDSGLTNSSANVCGINFSVSSSEGLNNWTLYSNDSAGNINSTNILFRQDSTGPVINIVSPQPTSYGVNNFSLNYTVSDAGVGLSACWYRNDTDTNNISINCGTNTTLSNSEGTHILYFWSNDTLNNVANVSVTYSISLTSPSITLNNPSNNLYTKTVNNTRFNFTASDPNGVSTCQLWGNWSGGWHKNQTLTSVVSGTQTNFNLLNLTQGHYIWSVWCNDSLNNGAFYYQNFTLNLDTTNPNATLNTPSNNSYLNYVDVNFTANLTDNFGIMNYSLYLNGILNQTVIASGALSSSVGIVVTLVDNIYTWFYQVFDLAGNTFSSENNTVTIYTFAGGNGSTSNPYQISSWKQLNYTRYDLTLSYILITNLSSSSSDYSGIGDSWAPIGDIGTLFTGSFNGNNNTISNLTINLPTIDYIGLFGDSSGSISNIGLVNVNILGQDKVGGIAGQSTGTINNSYSTGNVNGSSDVGGLVGISGATISNSYSTGNVNGASLAGGLVGLNTATISNSYSTGNVTVSVSYVGGLVGRQTLGTISNSYSTGNVTSPSIGGGLLGHKVGGSVSNSYYDNQTSGQSDTGKGVGKTTTQMKTIGTFSSWNISSTTININNGYPYLSWQAGSSTPIWLMSDGINPNATLTNPLNNSYANTNQNFTANVSDNNGLNNASLYIYNSSNSLINQTWITSISGSTSSIVGIVVNLVDGVYNWFYQVFDLAGNTFSSQNNTLTMDTVYPNLNVTYPLNTTYNYVITSMNYSLIDINPSSCWFFNGTANNTITCGTNITTKLNANEGSNTWIVYSNDSAGQTNSTSVTFIVDTTLPALTIISPLNQTYSNRDILLNVSASEPVSQYKYNLNSAASNVSFANPSTVTFNLGYNNLTVWATDNANNTNSTNVSFYVSYTNRLDLTLSTSLTPQIGTNLTLVAVTSTDNTNITICNFSLVAPSGIIFNNLNGTGIITWNSINYLVNESGIYNYNVTCTNELGNKTSGSNSFTVTPYTLTIFNPNPRFDMVTGTITNQRNETFLLYDNVQTNINYTVNITMDSQANFTLIYLSSIKLDYSDSSSTPYSFITSFQANAGTATNSYSGNVTLTNTVLGTQTVIPFNYTVNPSSSWPYIAIYNAGEVNQAWCSHDATCTASTSVAQGAIKTESNKIGYWDTTFSPKNCSAQFSGGLNQTWITASPAALNLNSSAYSDLVITASPTSTTQIGTYSGYMTVHCNQSDSNGFASDSDNRLRIDLTVTTGTPAGGSSGGPAQQQQNVTINATQIVGLCGNGICDSASPYNESYSTCAVDCPGNIKPLTDCFGGLNNGECILLKGTAFVWILGFMGLVFLYLLFADKRKSARTQRNNSWATKIKFKR